MVGGRGFDVVTRKQDVVAAAVQLQEYILPLSNLDLLLPPLDVGVFFCYKNQTCNPSVAAVARVGVLKKALTQVLVTYYALSGEVVANSVGEPEILCNNRGVEFIEAVADVELRELNLHNPDESVEGKLVPNKKHGILAVQATELRCGGVVVACTFDHRVADAHAANMFLVAWAEMALSKSPPLTTIPSFRRSLLSPRRPGQIQSYLDDMYVPITSPPPPPRKETNSLVSRIYYVTLEELMKLQALASSNGCKRSKLESFCAFLWKMVAGSDAGNKSCKMGIVVDGRSRFGNDLLANYFGNVLSITFKGLKENSLNWVADEVHEFLKCAVTKEHFLGLIDWVEAHRPVPGMTKIYLNEIKEGPSFVVSSGQRFPVGKVDFGWGVPVFGSYHFPWGGTTGYVMPMPSPVGSGDWIVYMHMMKGQLEVIEKQAGHVFMPLTVDYLGT